MNKFILLISTIVLTLSTNPDATGNTISVFVSILPHKHFVEQVGGNQVEVYALVGRGQSPETFNPTPRQMMALQSAKIYFFTGLPFEKALQTRIKSINPNMEWVDLRTGLDLLEIDDTSIHLLDDHGHNHDHGHDHEGDDPHIWLDPIRVIQQVRTISQSLLTLDEIDRITINKNTEDFISILQNTHSEIDVLFQSKTQRVFSLFHPSWGYFADRYELKQAAIETGGKKPSAKQLGKLIDFLQEQRITTIFVQEQMDTRLAQTIANQINGNVVTIDPLAEDYINNLRESAKKIAKALQ